jgi:Flp pilus assembly protein TadG
MKYFALGLAADRHGTMGVFGAISILSFMGVAGLAVDIGGAYVQQARLQTVADSAAMAGALSWINSGGSTSKVTATISSVVTANGWPNSVIQNSGQAYLTSSPKNSQNHAIQVTLAAQSPLTLLRALVPSMTSMTTGASSVAEIGQTGQPVCVLSLTTLIVDSGGDLSATGCSVAANSTSNQAILLNSGGKLSADSIITPGQVLKNNGSHLSGTLKQNAAAVPDPYASYQSQASSGFTSCTSFQNYQGQATISHGCWTNVNVNSGSSLTLQPGTYFFQNINVNSGATLTGTGGVTIVIQNNFSPSGHDIAITAPTSGNWAGMAIYAMGGMNINSGVRYDINGAIYSPSTALNLDSGSKNTFSSCTYIVAQSITFNSGAGFTYNSGCNGPTPRANGNSKAALVK